MEFLLDFDACEEDFYLDVCELTDADKKRIVDDLGFDDVQSVESVNIGCGADWIVALVIVSIVGYKLLKSGKNINEGIDGWIALGKKLKHLFKRHKIVSIDNDGATLLAIELIAQKEKIISLEKMHESTINLVDVSGFICGNNGLVTKPINYYVQAYNVNNEKVYIIGIKSTGETRIIQCYDVSMAPGFIEEIEVE